MILLTALLAGFVDAARPAESPKLGRLATAAEIQRMDLTVAADGSGLPPGSGSVAEGRAIFVAKCQACHGVEGHGGIADRLTGGIDTLHSAKPVRTVTSYWLYAPPLFDYIRRAMPLTAPQSLSDDDVYSLVAYLLSLDGFVPKDARLDAKSVAAIVMPNRNGFVSLAPKQFDGDVSKAARRRHR